MSPFQKLIPMTCFASVLLVLLTVATAAAQDDSPPATANTAQPTQPVQDQVPDETARKKSFLEIVAQLRDNEREINRKFTTMPIGFPEQQKRQMDEIERLKAENLTLQEQMEAAALAAFQANPGADRRATLIVLNMLSNKLDVKTRDGFFDPRGALEIADMMLKGGSETAEASGQIPIAEIAYLAFRASFAIEDFDRADILLKQIEAMGASLRPVIREQLEKTREKWNRELTIRKLESSSDDLPQVKFETTAGDFVVELFENQAPQTVGNFLSLVEKHVYDDLVFFLVQPGEFAQTGCPLGNGFGDPGYQIPCECNGEQIRHHFSGTLSMVTNGRDTGGSQFRIMHQPNSQFDGKFTAFGRVIEGMDVVYRLNRIDRTENSVDLVEPSKIIKATVIRKRDHDYPFTRLAKQPGSSAETPDSSSPLDPGKVATPGG